MATLRKIRRMVGLGPVGKPSRIATVYYNADVEEYQVKFEIDGVRVPGADYHTDCRDDAESTAEVWLKSFE